MKTTVHSVEEMQNYAAAVVADLDLADGTATVIGLSGDLGAGKTTFSQGFAKALAVTDTVQSPTFVIMKIYAIGGSSTAFQKGFRTLIHIDAYRLDKSSELLYLGFEKMTENPENIIVIEWPERVADILPKHATLLFEHGGAGADENERTVTYMKDL